MWANPGDSLSCWMFVCWRVCLVRRVPSALALSPADIQSAVRAEGGSREAGDNPVRAQGRQRKWLDIPDGGHSQENSCEGLNFTTSVWNSRLLPFSLTLSLSLPFYFLLPHSAPALSLSSNSKQKTQLSTQRWTESKYAFQRLILCFFLLFILYSLSSDVSASGRHIYFLPPSLFPFPTFFVLSPSLNFSSPLTHSFPLSKTQSPYGYDHP